MFKFNWLASLACLASMFFSLALVFTAAGLIQPQQLPLMQWNNLKNVRGKGRGWLAIWVLLCESYLFLVNTLPPPLTLALGTAVTALGAILLYLCQWAKVADVTWTNSLHR